MLPPLASDFRQIAPPPHHACAARSASHGLTRARLSSSTHILADAIHHGIYSGKVNKATFDRIIKPPTGISIPRSVLFKAVEAVVIPDKLTVTFKLSEPRPANFIMSSIASGWNVIVRKKT